MAAMTFASNAIEVPVDVALESVYVDLHEDLQDNLVHMVRVALNEDQAVELATLLLLGATKLRGERLEREETARAREVVENIPVTVEDVQRALRPCYCDSAYHPQGC
ncbi:hypothetical protein SEA_PAULODIABOLI_393 [Microbacterium phage PauloDiaboli]|nr:hypothetical protein SEA_PAULODIABOLI_38 [Microbacterium phage PauloDiaboli]QIG58074.1 hypothetical protein SEA_PAULODIABOLI_393 [Microbacterium phage PauloDiaboli]QWY83888.1 hypothetical protein SEA_A3WALLY_38 [Microbacterium phage A3Wally]QWY84198.1 hypothetical protein SEA_A3WALLY_391 [Microbacterium phage A3Wally]